MRVLALTTAYHPHLGGAELALQDIARHLPDDEIVVLTARRERALPHKDCIEGREVYRLGIGHPIDRHLFALLAPCYAWYLGREKRFDAAWAMMANQAGIAAVFSRVLLGIPYLLSIQEGDDEAWFAKRERLLGPLYGAIYRFAGVIQPISAFLEERCAAYDPTAPMRRIPNGFDATHFAPADAATRAATRTAYGLPEGPLAITASRLVRKNAVDITLRAVAAVPELHLVVAGTGPDASQLRALADELVLADRVHWLGDVSHEKLGVLLAACDLFVRPSRSEGLGTAFVEAMACGLPVVATPAGGIPDVVPPAAGALVPIEDPDAVATAIRRIVADPAPYQAAARAASTALSWSVLAARMRDAFSLITHERRVLVATGVYPPESGGPATYVARLQAELPARGVSLEVVPFRWVRRMPPGIRHGAYLWSLLVRMRGMQVVFAQDPVSVGVPAVVVATLAERPLVLKVVGDFAWEQGVTRFGVTDLLDDFLDKRYTWRVELLKALERWVARRARTVVTPSAYLDSVVARWGVPAAKRRVVHNAVHVPETPDRATTRAKYGWRDDEIIVISVGRLVSWKGVPETARAAAGIPHLRFVVVGDGPDRAAAEAAGAELLGAVPRSEALALTAAADICVLNTAYEGFSHQLLEAFMLGSAVITTPAGGNKEIARDRENALVIPVGDMAALRAAMTELAGDPVLRATLGAAARNDAATFTIDAMCDGIAAMLRA